MAHCFWSKIKISLSESESHIYYMEESESDLYTLIWPSMNTESHLRWRIVFLMYDKGYSLWTYITSFDWYIALSISPTGRCTHENLRKLWWKSEYMHIWILRIRSCIYVYICIYMTWSVLFCLCIDRYVFYIIWTICDDHIWPQNYIDR